VGVGAENAVTVLIPTLNEVRSTRFLRAIVSEQRIEEGVEFLFIDGRSDDGTRTLLERLAAEDPRVRVLDNPTRNIPSALRIGLAEARGEFVARMDAHTLFPPRYLAAGLARLRRGGADWVSGPQLAVGIDPATRRIASALHTKLGIGGAAFRRRTRTERESDAGYLGILRRARLIEVGGWDPGWKVNEDGELAARIRARGGRIVCIPEMASGYIPRRSLFALARQYANYGVYREKTVRRHPWSMRPSHLVPPTVVLWLLIAGLSGRSSRRIAALTAIYPGALILTAAGAAISGVKLREAVAMPFVLLTMHVSWGVGFLVGAVRFGPPFAAIWGKVRRPVRRPPRAGARFHAPVQ